LYSTYRTVMKIQTLDNVKTYWEKNTPQYWYTNEEYGTKAFYDDIQQIRYDQAYPYLPDVAEFDEHRGDEVLEVGCGQGTDLYQFAKGGAVVTGIDLTESAIAKTQQLFDAYEHPVTLRSTNAEDLSAFPDDSFDVVYSFGVLHHTPDTDKALGEVRRVLKPGGKAIIMLYAKGFTWMLVYLYWYILLGEIFRGSFEDSLSRHAEHKIGCPLARYYNKREARKAFSDFSNVHVQQLHCYSFDPNSSESGLLMNFKHGLCRLFNKTRLSQSIFGHNMIIKATK